MSTVRYDTVPVRDSSEYSYEYLYEAQVPYRILVVRISNLKSKFVRVRVLVR